MGNGGRRWLLRGERGSEMDETSMARGMEVRMNWAVRWRVGERRCGGSCVFMLEAFSLFYIRD